MKKTERIAADIQIDGVDMNSIERFVTALIKVLEYADVGLYVSDFYTGDILFANQKLAASANSTVNDLIGKKCWSIANKNNKKRCLFCPYKKLIDENGNPAGKCTMEYKLPNENTWIRSVNQAISWIDGRLALIVTCQDITETKNLESQLSERVFFDQRLYLKNGLKLEQDINKSQEKPSLIIFDITSLQKINEIYGRDTGDKLLLSVRNWIISHKTPKSELYRIGGDEFCLAVEQVNFDYVKSLANDLFQRFSEPWIFEIGNDRLSVFCNASIAVIPGDYIHTEDQLINLIERTLKVARNRARITIFDEKLDNDFKKLTQLEFSLKRCVRENMKGFDVHYQPIADPITGTWCGLEALCRWDSPELGQISPIMFIPEAERLELIGAIGLWVLETAIRDCKEWKLDKYKKFILDVNLSAVQFSDELLADKVLALLKKYNYPGDKLSLEITESTRFTFTDQSLGTIEQLRANNVIVTLDDFGTGYSSFNNLKTLPVNILKIERVFVSDIENDSYQEYLFHFMAELAHSVDMKLIAEGVENKEQMDILLRNGADMLQGYLFSKPLPFDEMQKQLERFYTVDKSFHIVRNRKIDLKTLLESENKYILTPGQNKIINQCMHVLFFHTNINNAINQVLKIAGVHLDVSRAYVYLCEEDNFFCNTHGWYADGISPQKELIERFSRPSSWIDALERDSIVVTSDISELPQDMYGFLNKYDVKAVVALPLWDGNKLSGFVGFDDCQYFRDWRPEEILMFYNLCLLITNSMINRKLQGENL